MKLWILKRLLLTSIACTKQEIIVDSRVPECALPGYVNDSMTRSQIYRDFKYVNRNPADTNHARAFVSLRLTR